MKKTYKITVKEAEHIVMKEVLKIENPKKYGQYPLYIEYIEGWIQEKVEGDGAKFMFGLYLKLNLFHQNRDMLKDFLKQSDISKIELGLLIKKILSPTNPQNDAN